MTHEAAGERLEAYLDNELDTSDAIALLEHTASCAACIEELAQLRALRTKLAAALPRYNAPVELRRRLLQLTEAEDPRMKRREKLVIRSGMAMNRWVFAMPVVLAFGVWIGIATRPSNEVAAEPLILESIRVLKSGHLFDVASSDKHTVKPWFAGKIDFSPIVPELAAQGYPLIGGRRETIDGHDAAALVYMKEKHVVQLYEWVTPEESSSAATSRGYNEIAFPFGTFECCIVSDITMPDLELFKQAVLANGAH